MGGNPHKQFVKHRNLKEEYGLFQKMPAGRGGYPDSKVVLGMVGKSLHIVGGGMTVVSS